MKRKNKDLEKKTQQNVKKFLKTQNYSRPNTYFRPVSKPHSLNFSNARLKKPEHANKLQQ